MSDDKLIPFESLPTGDNRQSSGTSTAVLNLLTFAAVLVCLILVGLFSFFFFYPSNPFNPFPPATQQAVIIIPVTETPIPDQLEPTATPQEPTKNAFTITPRPTQVEEITTTAEPTPTEIKSEYPFILQSDPSAIAASVLYPARECKWMGVGGQVVDLKGSSYTGITVQVGGYLANKSVLLTSLTGTVQQYGEAGYEFTLASEPIRSNKTLWIRLMDQAGIPLSGTIYFETFKDCNQNLIVINFKQVR